MKNFFLNEKFEILKFYFFCIKIAIKQKKLFTAFKFSTTMFAAAFCAIIFVWMTAMSTLQTYYITLRYFDKAMRLAIKAYKETAALKGEAMVPVGVIPDPYLEMVLRAVAQYEGDADKLKIETMEEIYYWFQIVEGY